jgi:hypothetical protein
MKQHAIHHQSASPHASIILTGPRSTIRFPENHYQTEPLRRGLVDDFSRVATSRPVAAEGTTPPSPEFLAEMRAKLQAADTAFLQRQYYNAFLGYADVFQSIQAFLSGEGEFVPELQDDAKRAGLGGAETLHQLGLYLQAAQSYALVAQGNPIPIPLTATDVAFIWLRWAQLGLDWGDALFRNSNELNDQLQGASDIYQSVVVVVNGVASVPDPQTHPSPLYQTPSLKPAADAAATIIANLPGLISGQTTVQTLGLNPLQAAVIIEVYRQVVKIQSGLDYWGHWHNTVPIWNFDYLQSIAINFAQLAISAERDFINFQDRNDQSRFTRQQLAQMVSQAGAEVDAANDHIRAAAAERGAYQSGAALADLRATDARANADEYANLSPLSMQFSALATQISGGDQGDLGQLNYLADQAMAGASVTFTGSQSDLFNNSHGAGAAAAQLAAARLNREYEVDSLRRTADEMGVAALQAQQEVATAQARLTTAVATATVARLHAAAAQQNLQAFDAQTFTPDTWLRMADLMWRLYRRYFDMALKSALLMQQAYNFETDQALQFIKADYSTDEVKGLLAADALMADIQQFTYDLITSTAGKPQPLTQTIALAQRYPFAFERQFRKTGVLEFETRIDDFDLAYPGTYAGRIENVEVELVGLVPVTGISGTLTNSGISAYRTPASASAPGTSGLKYRLQSKETLVLSDYSTRRDNLLLSSDQRMMRIFQGAGVVSTWRLEIPKAINDIDYGALVDVRFTLYYKARYDPDLHDRVLKELASRPGINARQRGLPLRWVYPDAFFKFQDTGSLSLTLKAFDFKANETAPLITQVGAVIATTGGLAAGGIVVDLSTPGKNAATATSDNGGLIDNSTSGNPWSVLIGGSALGDYLLTVSASKNPSLVKNGKLDLSGIANIALILAYTFTPKS